MRVSVNRVVIRRDEINLESGHVDGGSIEERQDEAARRLVVRELLRQRAETAGFSTDGRVDEAIEEVMDAEVAVPDADETACRRYFEANRERFRTPEEIEVRHILLAAAPDDSTERVKQRDAAESILEQVREAPGRFAELAGRHSDCPSADQGGHLGVIGRGQTVPELEHVVLRLPVGIAERPVETRYGFHVVEVLQRSGGEPLEYDQVRDLVAEYLQERSWRRAVSQYIGRLAADADIKGVEIEASDSPLVQ